MGACLVPATILPLQTAANNKSASGAASAGTGNTGRRPGHMSTIAEVTCDTQLDSSRSLRTNSPIPKKHSEHIHEKRSPKPPTPPRRMIQNLDKVEHFTPEILSRLSGSYYGITGSDKKLLALNTFKRLLRTMPSAATCFAAAASESDDQSDGGVDFDEDGTVGLRKKGTSLLGDFEVCLAGLNDSKVFDGVTTTISKRQHTWVVSRQVLRVVMFSLECEIVAMVKSLGDKIPDEYRCQCEESNASQNEFGECLTCENWKKLFQFLFNHFVNKIRGKRSNKTC